MAGHQTETRKGVYLVNFKIYSSVKRHSLAKLILSLMLPLTIGGLAGIFTSREIAGWYSSLNRPSFNPPNWVFGPVWTTLYIVMGISLYLVWILPPSRQRQHAMMMYGVQLALNFIWSFLFFYFKRIDLAVGEIILLWLSIAAMLVLFFRLRPVAAYLNIPYLFWVSFATILNIAYAQLN
jgi:benzodiazapine receptor